MLIIYLSQRPGVAGPGQVADAVVTWGLITAGTTLLETRTTITATVRGL